MAASVTHKYLNIQSSTTTFKNNIIKRSLDTIYENFVKANGGIARICKRLYMQVLIKELGIDSKLNPNSVYKLSSVQ